jgi:DNA-binding CsgD family transcriptional regulator
MRTSPQASDPAYTRAPRDSFAAEGVDAEVVAAQLLRSELAASSETVGLLRAAAPLAVRRGAPEAGISYLRRALAEEPSGEERTALLAELGRAELVTRDPAAADHLRQALAGCQDPLGRAAIRMDLADAVLNGDFGLRLDLLRKTLDELGDLAPDLSGRLEALIAGTAAIHAREGERIPDAMRRLSVLADGSGPAARIARLSLAFVMAIRSLRVEDVEAHVKWGLDGGRFIAEDASESVFAMWAGHALVTVDALEPACSLASEMIAAAARRGSIGGFVEGSLVRAFAELRAGMLAEARADAQAALDLARQHRLVWAVHGASYLAEILLDLGQPEAAGAVIEGARLNPGLVDSLPEVILFRARGIARWARGRIEEGIADVRAAGGLADAIGLGPMFPWRQHLALMLRSSSSSEARQLAETDLREANRLGLARGVGIALRTVAALGPDAEAVDLLKEAIGILENSPAVLELARAQLELGAALRRLHDQFAARELLRQALEIATRCGATPVAERARGEAVLAGARPRRPRLRGIHALTPSELRVARLATEGRSNREVAQALFITTKTVQDHLSSAYGKLQINSRAELATALAADGG